MKSCRYLPVLVVAFLLAGCAMSGTTSGPGPARSRCNTDGSPSERPLFLLFCVEAP